MGANQLHYRTSLLSPAKTKRSRQGGKTQNESPKRNKEKRHRRDLNSRGQSPLAFKTNSLTTRTRCRVCACLGKAKKIVALDLAARQKINETTTTRFELARAEPSRFRIYLLNHSDTLSPSGIHARFTDTLTPHCHTHTHTHTPHTTHNAQCTTHQQTTQPQNTTPSRTTHTTKKRVECRLAF